jgi:hypothetical protein
VRAPANNRLERLAKTADKRVKISSTTGERADLSASAALVRNLLKIQAWRFQSGSAVV